MGIREAINKNSTASAVVAALGLCCVGILIVWETRTVAPQQVTKAFYSVDDGKTWFVDEDSRIFPFDYNGQQAYRVDVYKTSDGKEFVGVIEGYTDSARAKLAQLRAQPNPDPIKMASVCSSGLRIKRPGETDWHPLMSQQGAEIMGVSSPDGRPVVGVMP